MSSGQKHSGITIGLSGGIGAGAIFSYVLTPIDLLAMSIGCLAGVLLTPDQDHDSLNISHHYIRGILGDIGQKWWEILWTPYKVSIKHRSFWSHTPIIGTFIRLLYVVFPVIILVLPIRDQRPNYLKLVPQSLIAQVTTVPFLLLCALFYLLVLQTPNVDWLAILLAAFVGISVSDLGHLLADL